MHHYALTDRSSTAIALEGVEELAVESRAQPSPRAAAWLRDVGSVFRQYREAQHLSISELAEMAHVEVSYLERIERGEVDPRTTILARLAAALGMSLPEILAEIR